MTLWLVLTLMISAAVLLVAAPLLRKFEGRHSALSGEVEVFRDQLKEVEREAADGFIDVDQIETARLEIKRRLLGADRANEAPIARLSRAERYLAVVVVAGIVVFGSVSLYAVKGSPELPSSPASSRAAKPTASDAAGRLTAIAPLQADKTWDQSRAAAEHATVGVMIARLVERLRHSPNNPEDWRLLGWCYFKAERFTEAAAAYAKAIELLPNVASLRISRGEALVQGANGLVTDEAKMIFDEVLNLDRKNPRARFFKGLMNEQAGDKATALDDWVALLNDVSEDEEWVPDLKQRIAELAFDVKFNVAKNRKPHTAGTADTLKLLNEQYGSQSTTSSQEGPSAEVVRNAEAMAPTDRVAMIRGMVDGLAGHLEQSPRDLEGWIELMRSRTVLHEMGTAREALDRALKVFADSPRDQRRISTAAEELGLTR